MQTGTCRSLGQSDDPDDPEKFWTHSKTQILKMSESCLRGTPGTSNSFLIKKTLKTIEGSRKARLGGKTVQYRELKRQAVRAVRSDKEAQVRGVCETVVSHLWSTLVLSTEESARCFL